VVAVVTMVAMTSLGRRSNLAICSPEQIPATTATTTTKVTIATPEYNPKHESFKHS
jgi:hypothetical protein